MFLVVSRILVRLSQRQTDRCAAQFPNQGIPSAVPANISSEWGRSQLWSWVSERGNPYSEVEIACASE